MAHQLRDRLAGDNRAAAEELVDQLRLELVRRKGSPAQRFTALVELANAYSIGGGADLAASAVAAAADIAESGAVGDFDQARLSEATGRWHKLGGRYDDALVAYRDALVRLRRSDHPEAAALLPYVLANIGDLLEKRGQYPDGLAAYEQALPLLSDLRSRASLLSNIGRLHVRLGAFREAAEVQREALDIRSASGDLPLEAQSRVHLASALSGAGQFAAAIEELEAAAGIYKQLPERGLERAVVFQNMAEILRLLGQQSAAERQYERAEATLLRVRDEGSANRRLDEAVAHLASGRGAMAFEAHDYDHAIRRFKQAATRFRRLDASHPELDRVDQRLVVAYVSAGRLDQARRIIAQRAGGLAGEDADDAGWTHALGALRRAEGRYDQAVALNRRAAEALDRRHGRGHPDAVSMRLNVAVLLARQGRYRHALAEANRAETARDERLDDIFATQTEGERLTTVLSLRRDLQVTLTAALHLRDAKATEKAYELVLRRKAIVAEASAAALVPAKGAARRLRFVRAAIGRAALIGSVPVELLAERRRLEATLNREVGGDLVARRTKLRVADVAAALPPESLFIEFVRADPLNLRPGLDVGAASLPPRYIAFSLIGGAPESLALRDVGDAEEIDAAVAAWRSAITLEAEGPRVGANERAVPGQFLANALLQALEPSPLIRHIVVATDGALSRVPFCALRTADGKLLVESFDLSVVDTGRDLIRWGAPRHRAKAPFVLGDVAYDAGPRSADKGHALAYSIDRFEPLPATAREAARVAALLGVRPVLRGAAREGRVKRARSPAILHLATHGFFLKLDDAPLLPNPLTRSAIALVGFNRALAGRGMWPDAEDGVLTAEDVLELSLRGTELATLSACETGLGESIPNEGVFGLRRTLGLAGVRTVVMSLWKVPDAATAHLMVRFYQELVSGAGVAAALRTAQNDVRAQLPSPWHWAGFVVGGDPSPLAWRPASEPTAVTA